jgi:arsenate reductase (thioredoxin)
MQRAYNILFLSRRNSARSLMAEAVVNRHGRGKFRGFSAAVEPSASIDPIAVDVMKLAGYPTEGLRPKHWREFSGSDAPDLDFVFTLSDTAAGETLPEWRGRPVSAHWRYRDPVKVDGAEWEKRRAFGEILAGLERQLKIFVELPLSSLDRIALKTRLDALGEEEFSTAGGTQPA